MGQIKILAVVDYPDNVTAEAIMTVVLEGGAAILFKAIPIMTAAEAVKAMKKANDILYRPPS